MYIIYILIPLNYLTQCICYFDIVHELSAGLGIFFFTVDLLLHPIPRILISFVFTDNMHLLKSPNSVSYAK